MSDTIPQSTYGFRTRLEERLGHPADLVIEELLGGELTLLYLSSITDRSLLNSHLLKPLAQRLMNQTHSWTLILSLTSASGRAERRELSEAVDDLFDGRSLLHLAGSPVLYSFNTRVAITRPPSDPMGERSLRGPRVSWVESLDDNTALIRQNIRGSRLRVEPMLLGRNTRTRLHVFYLEDVANPHLVSAVRERINAIDIDGIVESSYVEQLISDNPNSLFSLTQASERVDKTVAGILEGRVTIMVDGSSQVILVPTTINELYQSPEDFYFGAYYGSFLRAFRILGNNIAVALPGLYVALVAVNPQLLPARFALTIAGGLRGVAFPLIIELLIMEIIIEVFREASLRLPQPVSQTLGVTAGVVLGIASVAAGLVSNITLVVVLITAIASFSGPNYAIGMSWRLLRYFLILAAAMGGLYGLTLAGLLILAHAAIQESFGVPYLSPWAPLRFPDLGDTVTILPPWKKGRPRTYEPQDTVRSRKEGKKDE